MYVSEIRSFCFKYVPLWWVYQVMQGRTVYDSRLIGFAAVDVYGK
jgi:hypothetical protein